MVRVATVLVVVVVVVVVHEGGSSIRMKGNENGEEWGFITVTEERMKG